MTVTLGGDTAVPAPGVLERPHLVWDHGCFIFQRAGTTHMLLTEPNAQCQGGQSKPKGNLASGGVRKHSREQV